MRPIFTLGRSDKRVVRRLRRLAKRDKDVELVQRCLIVLGWAKRVNSSLMAVTLDCALSTVYRIRANYEKDGILGLIDHRADNGQRKVGDEFVSRLAELVEKTPLDFGWKRPTWTRELLAKQMASDTGIKVSPRTLDRSLRAIGAGWKRGRPGLLCPWPKRERQARLKRIRCRVEALPSNEVAFYEDEVDIHLNPKIGPDWMLRCQQKLILTPGKNVKRYLAGALNPKTGAVYFVEGERKASLLFIALIEHLVTHFRWCRRIHVVLDNFSIHDSKITRRFIHSLEGKVVLHFLPPYCPGDNPIEGLWKELHANVTRNHRCGAIEELMASVRAYLKEAAPYPRSTFTSRKTG